MEQTPDLLDISLYDDSEKNDIETKITRVLIIKSDDNYLVGGTIEEEIRHLYILWSFVSPS